MLSSSPKEQLDCFGSGTNFHPVTLNQYSNCFENNMPSGVMHYAPTYSRVQDSQHFHYSDQRGLGQLQENVPQYLTLDSSNEFESFVNQQYSALFPPKRPRMILPEQMVRDHVECVGFQPQPFSHQREGPYNSWVANTEVAMDKRGYMRDSFIPVNHSSDLTSSFVQPGNTINRGQSQSMDDIFTSYLLNGNPESVVHHDNHPSFANPKDHFNSSLYPNTDVGTQQQQTKNISQARPNSLSLKRTHQIPKEAHEVPVSRAINNPSVPPALSMHCNKSSTPLSSTIDILGSPLALGTLLSPSPSYQGSHQKGLLSAPPPLSPQGTLKPISQPNTDRRQEPNVRQLLNSPPPPVEHAWLVPKTLQVLPGSKSEKISINQSSLPMSNIISPSLESPLSSHLPHPSFGHTINEQKCKRPSSLDTGKNVDHSQFPQRNPTLLSSDSESERFGSPPPLYPSLGLSPSVHNNLPTTPQSLQFMDPYKYPFIESPVGTKEQKPISPYRVHQGRQVPSEKTVMLAQHQEWCTKPSVGVTCKSKGSSNNVQSTSSQKVDTSALSIHDSPRTCYSLTTSTFAPTNFDSHTSSPKEVSSFIQTGNLRKGFSSDDSSLIQQHSRHRDVVVTGVPQPVISSRENGLVVVSTSSGSVGQKGTDKLNICSKGTNHQSQSRNRISAKEVLVREEINIEIEPKSDLFSNAAIVAKHFMDPGTVKDGTSSSHLSKILVTGTPVLTSTGKVSSVSLVSSNKDNLKEVVTASNVIRISGNRKEANYPQTSLSDSYVDKHHFSKSDMPKGFSHPKEETECSSGLTGQYTRDNMSSITNTSTASCVSVCMIDSTLNTISSTGDAFVPKSSQLKCSTAGNGICTSTVKTTDPLCSQPDLSNNLFVKTIVDCCKGSNEPSDKCITPGRFSTANDEYKDSKLFGNVQKKEKTKEEKKCKSSYKVDDFLFSDNFTSDPGFAGETSTVSQKVASVCPKPSNRLKQVKQISAVTDSPKSILANESSTRGGIDVALDAKPNSPIKKTPGFVRLTLCHSSMANITGVKLKVPSTKNKEKKLAKIEDAENMKEEKINTSTTSCRDTKIDRMSKINCDLNTGDGSVGKQWSMNNVKDHTLCSMTSPAPSQTSQSLCKKKRRKKVETSSDKRAIKETGIESSVICNPSRDSRAIHDKKKAGGSVDYIPTAFVNVSALSSKKERYLGSENKFKGKEQKNAVETVNSLTVSKELEMDPFSLSQYELIVGNRGLTGQSERTDKSRSNTQYTSAGLEAGHASDEICRSEGSISTVLETEKELVEHTHTKCKKATDDRKTSTKLETSQQFSPDKTFSQKKLSDSLGRIHQPLKGNQDTSSSACLAAGTKTPTFNPIHAESKEMVRNKNAQESNKDNHESVIVQQEIKVEETLGECPRLVTASKRIGDVIENADEVGTTPSCHLPVFDTASISVREPSSLKKRVDVCKISKVHTKKKYEKGGIGSHDIERNQSMAAEGECPTHNRGSEQSGRSNEFLRDRQEHFLETAGSSIENMSTKETKEDKVMMKGMNHISTPVTPTNSSKSVERSSFDMPSHFSTSNSVLPKRERSTSQIGELVDLNTDKGVEQTKQREEEVPEYINTFSNRKDKTECPVVQCKADVGHGGTDGLTRRKDDLSFPLDDLPDSSTSSLNLKLPLPMSKDPEDVSVLTVRKTEKFNIDYVQSINVEIDELPKFEKKKISEDAVYADKNQSTESVPVPEALKLPLSTVASRGVPNSVTLSKSDSTGSGECTKKKRRERKNNLCNNTLDTQSAQSPMVPNIIFGQDKGAPGPQGNIFIPCVSDSPLIENMEENLRSKNLEGNKEVKKRRRKRKEKIKNHTADLKEPEMDTFSEMQYNLIIGGKGNKKRCRKLKKGQQEAPQKEKETVSLDENNLQIQQSRLLHNVLGGNNFKRTKIEDSIDNRVSNNGSKDDTRHIGKDSIAVTPSTQLPHKLSSPIQSVQKSSTGNKEASKNSSAKDAKRNMTVPVSMFQTQPPGVLFIKSPGDDKGRHFALPQLLFNAGYGQESSASPTSPAPVPPRLLFLNPPTQTIPVSPNSTKNESTSVVSPVQPSNLVFVRSPDGSSKLYQSVLHLVPTAQMPGKSKSSPSTPLPLNAKFVVLPTAVPILGSPSVVTSATSTSTTAASLASLGKVSSSTSTSAPVLPLKSLAVPTISSSIPSALPSSNTALTSPLSTSCPGKTLTTATTRPLLLHSSGSVMATSVVSRISTSVMQKTAVPFSQPVPGQSASSVQITSIIPTQLPPTKAQCTTTSKKKSVTSPSTLIESNFKFNHTYTTHQQRKDNQFLAVKSPSRCGIIKISSGTQFSTSNEYGEERKPRVVERKSVSSKHCHGSKGPVTCETIEKEAQTCISKDIDSKGKALKPCLPFLCKGDGDMKSPISGNLFDSLFQSSSNDSADYFKEDLEQSAYSLNTPGQRVKAGDKVTHFYQGPLMTSKESAVHNNRVASTEDGIFKKHTEMLPSKNWDSLAKTDAVSTEQSFNKKGVGAFSTVVHGLLHGNKEINVVERPLKYHTLMSTSPTKLEKVSRGATENKGTDMTAVSASDDNIIFIDDVSNDSSNIPVPIESSREEEQSEESNCKQRSVREERAIRYAMMQFEIMERKRLRKERRQKRLDAKMLKVLNASIDKDVAKPDSGKAHSTFCHKESSKSHLDVIVGQKGKPEIKKTFWLRKASHLNKLKDTKRRFEEKLHAKRQGVPKGGKLPSVTPLGKSSGRSINQDPSRCNAGVSVKTAGSTAAEMASVSAASVRNKSYFLVPSYNGFMDFSPVIVESRTRSQATREDRERFEKPKLPVLVVEQLGEKKNEIIVEDGQDMHEKLAKESLLAEPEPVQECRRDLKKLSYNRTTGETPLHKAARRGYSDVVELCIADGADVDAKDNAGWTALHEACSKGHSDVVKLLLMCGADPNCCSESGVRPIHDAAEGKNLEIIRHLLSFGADPLLTTYSGITTMECLKSPGAKDYLKDFLTDKQLQDIDHDSPEYKQGRWKFSGSSSAIDLAKDIESDIFDDIPLAVESHVTFESSREPLLPLYRLPVRDKGQVVSYRNYHVLEDVLSYLKQPRSQFFKKHKVELRKMLWKDFCSDLLHNELMTTPPSSLLLSRNKEGIIELVHLGPYASRKLFNLKCFTEHR